MAYIYVMHPDNRIREMRKKAGVSQFEVARAIGMHQTHFGKLENGTRPLTLDWARRISKVLGCTVADLLSSADHPLRLEDDERRLIERYRAGSAAEKAMMQRVTDAITPLDDQSAAA